VGIYDNFPDECSHVLKVLGKVYQHDADAREQNLTNDQRLVLPQSKSGPLMEKLKEWFDAQFEEKNVEPNSGLGQVKTDEKSNEITAIPELLKTIEICGCIVTIEAMGCQKNTAETIIARNGEYVFSLKGNQSNLHDDVKLVFETQKEHKFRDIRSDYFETVDADHWKIEIRRYWGTSDIDWFQGKENWRNLKTIYMVEHEIQYVIKVKARPVITSAASAIMLLKKSIKSQRLKAG